MTYHRLNQLTKSADKIDTKKSVVCSAKISWFFQQLLASFKGWRLKKVVI